MKSKTIKVKIGKKHIGIIVAAVSLVLLVLGVSLPCIEVKSRLIDLIPLGTERKTILGLIAGLLKNNVLLALLVILFSLVIPVLKLSLTVFMIVRKEEHFNRLIKWLVLNIGKWSMVDVFTMAIVVSVLSFDNMRIKVFSTSGELKAGFYFFLAYGLLSIVSTFFLEKRD